MRIPKQYGASKSDSCVYCGAPALFKNKLKLPVCKTHKDETEYPEFKCACGDWVDLKEGKYGVYGLCLRCGPKNMNTLVRVERKEESKVAPKEKIDPTAYPLL